MENYNYFDIIVSNFEALDDPVRSDICFNAFLKLANATLDTGLQTRVHELIQTHLHPAKFRNAGTLLGQRQQFLQDSLERMLNKSRRDGPGGAATVTPLRPLHPLQPRGDGSAVSAARPMLAEPVLTPTAPRAPRSVSHQYSAPNNPSFTYTPPTPIQRELTAPSLTSTAQGAARNVFQQHSNLSLPSFTCTPPSSSQPMLAVPSHQSAADGAPQNVFHHYRNLSVPRSPSVPLSASVSQLERLYNHGGEDMVRRVLLTDPAAPSYGRQGQRKSPEEVQCEQLSARYGGSWTAPEYGGRGAPFREYGDVGKGSKEKR